MGMLQLARRSGISAAGSSFANLDMHREAALDLHFTVRATLLPHVQDLLRPTQSKAQFLVV